MKLDDLDQDRFESMMKALELQALWTELSSLVTPGWMLPHRQLRPLWRAYPIAPSRMSKVMSGSAFAALRSVTGQDRDSYTPEQVNATRNVTLACLEAYAPEVEA